jgi:hypothetical protein
MQYGRHGEPGARYTNIEYDREDGGRNIEVSNIGIYINFKLPH